ncbi:MAG: mechanosensitive ion channel family protein [Nocardioidaceae bacterium]
MRVVLKTAPLEQWSIAREMRERIKDRFDAEGIEIPLPQRMVWHRDMPSDQETPRDSQTTTDPRARPPPVMATPDCKGDSTASGGLIARSVGARSVGARSVGASSSMESGELSPTRVRRPA